MKSILITTFSIFLLSFYASAEKTLNHKMPVKIYMAGEVKAPKSLSVPPDIGLIAAVYAAGGPTELGSMQRITILREGKVTVLDRRKHPKEVFLLKSGDVIIVPSRKWSGI